MPSSKQWQVYNTTPLVQILSLSAREPPWKMAFKKVNNLATNMEVYQFQVECVSYLNLKKTRHSRIKLISVCLLNFMVKHNHTRGKQLNTTVPVPLIGLCSMRTGSNSFSRCWVLLSIASLKNMCVLIICVFKDNQSCRYYPEYLMILNFIRFQELAYHKTY